jgi:hypothetical protein
LEVRHGEETHRLEAGDSVYFDATTIHSYACAGDAPATALIVTLQHPLAVANGTRPTAAVQRERGQAAMLRPVGEVGRNGIQGDRVAGFARRVV